MSAKNIINIVLSSVLLVGLYILWTHSTDPGNLAVIGIAALIISVGFVRSDVLPVLSPRRIYYAATFVDYLFIAIIKSNLDVAGRVIRKNIPIKPGIVKVRTRLKSKVGRMILANSITLTPGTLSVDVNGDYFFIHWIDVSSTEVETASAAIVAGFEKYLEVIFG
ncbi:MAG: Na+/H+ antiporter subunit E [Calditrichia bacterium]